MTVHSYSKSLAETEAREKNPVFWEVYQRLWPAAKSMRRIRDPATQKAGVDVELEMPVGEPFRIEEKVRPARAPRDIAIEVWSKEEQRIPGWFLKPGVQTDFLAYFFLRYRRCYVFPFRSLRAAYDLHGSRWKELADQGRDDRAAGRRNRSGFDWARAENEENGECWVTVSLCVPIATLKDQVGGCRRVNW